MSETVYHLIRCIGSQDDLWALLMQIGKYDHDPLFDFNRIIPEPADHGGSTADWRITNWGSAYNAAESKVYWSRLEETNASLDLCIQYALCQKEQPTPVLNKLQEKYPHIKFIFGYQANSQRAY